MTDLIPTVPGGEHDASGGVIPRRGGPGHLAKGTETQAAGESLPTISVVDDDENIHLFLKDLGDVGHFQLVSSFFNAAQALDRLPQDHPQAVVMDVRLPDISGIDCATKLKAIVPEIPILMLTGYPDGQVFFRSLMAGARGFLVKPVSADDFLNAIDDILSGRFALAKQVEPFLTQLVKHAGQVTREGRLTAREEEILACVFQGMQDKEIASALGIGTATVHTHMHRLFEKLGVHSRREIVAKYLEFH